jgi:hypothetical protein
MVKVSEALPGKDYKLSVKLDNGRSGTFDVLPFLDKGIFTELRDKTYFAQVKVHGRSISWPHKQDFCADTIEALMK